MLLSFVIPVFLVAGLLYLLVRFRGGVEAGLANFVSLLPIGYAFAAGMVASANPCGLLMLPSYVFSQIKPTKVKKIPPDCACGKASN